MNPAFSIIFLTTLIGMGQGLFIAICCERLFTAFGELSLINFHWYYAVASCVALILFGLGLIASFFHLGRPERAWRAATKWKTSWLSREVIILPLTMLLVLICTLLYFLPELNVQLGSSILHLSFIFEIVAIIFIIGLFVCTSMIYACLPFLQEWHSPLTFFNFVLMGLASGFTLASLLSFFLAPNIMEYTAILAIVYTGLAAIFRVISLLRNKSLRPPTTIQSAIGAKHKKVKQLSQGAMGGSFNTKHFFHGKSKCFLKSIKWLFLMMVFVIPITLLALQLAMPCVLFVLLAFIIQYLGLIAERWYFFAEVNHPQNIYYQRIS